MLSYTEQNRTAVVSTIYIYTSARLCVCVCMLRVCECVMLNFIVFYDRLTTQRYVFRLGVNIIY